jgi:hypothetical protein
MDGGGPEPKTLNTRFNRFIRQLAGDFDEEQLVQNISLVNGVPNIHYEVFDLVLSGCLDMIQERVKRGLRGMIHPGEHEVTVVYEAGSLIVN